MGSVPLETTLFGVRWKNNLPPVTLIPHGLGDLDEASNVATGHQGGQLALLGLDVSLGGVEAVLEGTLHDTGQLVVNLLPRPAQALAVLCHLQTRHGNTTAVGSLSWTVPHTAGALGATGLLKDVDGLLGAAHVGALGNELAASSDQCLGLLLGDLVLGSARQGHVDGTGVGPGAGALNVLVLGGTVLGGGDKVGQGAVLELEGGDGLDGLGLEAGVGDEGTARVGEGDDLGTELDGLEGSVLGNVTGARDSHALASPAAGAGVLEHVADVVDQTVTGGLCDDEVC